MSATIKIELDNQTRPGFNQLGSDIDRAAAKTSAFEGDTDDLAYAIQNVAGDIREEIASLIDLQRQYDKAAREADDLKRAEADALKEANKGGSSLSQRITAMSTAFSAMVQMGKGAIQMFKSLEEQGNPAASRLGKSIEGVQDAFQDLATDPALQDIGDTIAQALNKAVPHIRKFGDYWRYAQDAMANMAVHGMVMFGQATDDAIDELARMQEASQAALEQRRQQIQAEREMLQLREQQKQIAADLAAIEGNKTSREHQTAVKRVENEKEIVDMLRAEKEVLQDLASQKLPTGESPEALKAREEWKRREQTQIQRINTLEERRLEIITERNAKEKQHTADIRAWNASMMKDADLDLAYQDAKKDKDKELTKVYENEMKRRYGVTKLTIDNEQTLIDDASEARRKKEMEDLERAKAAAENIKAMVLDVKNSLKGGGQNLVNEVRGSFGEKALLQRTMKNRADAAAQKRLDELRGKGLVDQKGKAIKGVKGAMTQSQLNKDLRRQREMARRKTMQDRAQLNRRPPRRPNEQYKKQQEEAKKLEKEMLEAQGQLTNEVIDNAAKQGGLNKAQVDGMKEAAKAIQDGAKQTIENTEAIEEIREVIRETQTMLSESRGRSQRGGLR